MSVPLVSQFSHCVLFPTRLVAGDVDGKFEQLFTRVGNIQKKSGQFDVRLFHIVVINKSCLTDATVYGNILHYWR